MNYRHAFHAGNFADVLKHAILTRILVYLGQKEAAFRVIDTHAGDGLYDLAGEQAAKTQEWRSGIGLLIEAQAQMKAPVRALLAPYLDLVAPGLAGEAPHYPGSPLIAARLLRVQDRMIFCEKHPAAFAALKQNLGRDRRARIVEIDGFTGLCAYVPPVERRGLVLIDPPFEAREEFAQILKAMDSALRKWPTGSYMIWFPVKDRGAVELFYRGMGEIARQAQVRDAWACELAIDAILPDRPLAGCGLVLINPPFVLEDEARLILPALTDVLAVSERAGHALGRI